MTARQLIERPFVWLLILPILLYRRLLSPLLPARCRFYPSCSEYGILALEKYGPLKGLWWTIRRVGRCHPWHEGGYDPP